MIKIKYFLRDLFDKLKAYLFYIGINLNKYNRIIFINKK